MAGGGAREKLIMHKCGCDSRRLTDGELESFIVWHSIVPKLGGDVELLFVSIDVAFPLDQFRAWLVLLCQCIA